MDGIADALRTELSAWPAPHPLRDRYVEFLGARGGGAMHRGGGREHVTASCFVFSRDFEHVLLCYHRKGQFWVQPGGHLEPADADTAAAAFREASEETGLRTVEPVTRAALDLHRHDLHAGFGSCSVHWDIGYAGVAERHAEVTVSSESEAVRWYPITDLPDVVPPAAWRRRLRTVLAAAQQAAA